MHLSSYRAQKQFSQKHLLCLQSYTPDEILQVLSTAIRLKDMRQMGQSYTPLSGKKMAMIFTKPSMRTRVSFEIGCVELGGHPFMLTKEEIGLGGRETVADVARVLSRYCDGIMIRTFAQADIEGLAQFGSIPIINGLSDDFHPCQALADLLTLYEHKGSFVGQKICYLGDGNNVAASLLIICSKLGVDLSIGCPQGYSPPAQVVQWAQENAQLSHSKINVYHDPLQAVKGADAVYTDVWASMGQEAQATSKNEAFRAFQVNQECMKNASPDAIFMHCLPAHRGDEVTDAVIESDQSVVFDQAENRLHVQKAVMALLMG